jgi:photosystem II stability/assembly factor-like uncharacterized protein
MKSKKPPDRLRWVQMSRRFAALVSLAIFVAASGSSRVWAGSDVWTSIGPKGGPIRALTVDSQNPGTVYAGTSGGGVFKSTDGGRNWTAANSGLTELDVRILAIDPQDTTTLYAGTHSSTSGVFRSTDGGASWSAVSSGLPEFPGILALAIDPQYPNTLYAGTQFNGVFKSTDWGASWTAINFGLPTDPTAQRLVGVTALVIDPRNTSTVFAWVGGNGVFKSTDGGASWSAASSGLPAQPFGLSFLAIDPQAPSTLYAGKSGIGVFKSTDGGATWNSVNSGLPNNFNGASFLAIDPETPGTVYAATGGGVFKTADGGASWSAASSGLPMIAPSHVAVLAVDPQNPGTIYAGTNDGGTSNGTGHFGDGVFKSTDGGASWSASNSGLTLTSVNALVIAPQNSSTLYAALAGATGEVFKSTDGGASWSTVSSGLMLTSVAALAVDPQNPGTLYAGGDGGVFKTTDAGASWSAANSGLPTVGIAADGSDLVAGVNLLAIDPQDTSTLYAGTVGLFKSTDGGASWSAANSGLPIGPGEPYALGVLAVDPQNPSTLYAGTNANFPHHASGGVFESTDGGASWVEADYGLPPFPSGFYVGARSLAIDLRNPDTVYAGLNFLGIYGGVFKSTDGRASWTEADSGLPTGPWGVSAVDSLLIDPQNPSTVYVGVNGAGVFKTTDAGGSWTAVNFGLTTLSVNVFAIDPQNTNTVYAGTNGGGVFAITFGP